MISTDMFPFSAEKPAQTQVNVYAAGAIGQLAGLCQQLFGQAEFCLVSDETIWAATHSHFTSFQAQLPRHSVYLFPATPPLHADYEQVKQLTQVLKQKVPIAVGSGTINDLVKRAAFELHTPYVTVPTAPSVDGFLAYGAAITTEGFKSTLDCPAPLAVVADATVLEQSPDFLIAAGFGDLVAKLQGGADWLIADELGIEAVDKPCWTAVQPLANAILPLAPALKQRDPSAIQTLYEGLAASGLAMQWYHDSRPASGAEHLLSHTWEMKLPEPYAHVLHGKKVALGTLITRALSDCLFDPQGRYSRLVAQQLPVVKNFAQGRLALAEKLLDDSEASARIRAVLAAKSLPDGELQARRQKIQASWPQLQQKMNSQLPSFAVLKKALLDIGCPTEPAALGLSRDECINTFIISSFIRKRYTILDLAAELGFLTDLAEDIFSSAYFSEYAV